MIFSFKRILLSNYVKLKINKQNLDLLQTSTYSVKLVPANRKKTLVTWVMGTNVST